MTVTLTIPLEIPSWNKVKDFHWTQYRKVADQWYWATKAAILKLPKEQLVEVKKYMSTDAPKYRLTVISRRKKLLDYSNMCYKFAEDGTKTYIIPDDSPKYIEHVELKQELIKGKVQPETILEIELL